MGVVKNQIIPLTITALSHEGSGIGRHEGLAVFVPMTAVGDKIEAKIVKVLKTSAYGIIQKILEPSPYRVENDCPVYRRCGGCGLRHINYAHEMQIKENWVRENLKRIGGVDIPFDASLPSPESSRYRNKAQYPVRRVNGKIRAGFFARRSHDLVPVEDCLLQPEFFSDAVRAVIGFMEDCGVEPYNEADGTGIVRHIFIRCAEASNEAMLCLVINAVSLPHTQTLIERINRLCPEITSIVINENRADTNVIFGGKTSVLWGGEFIADELCGVRVNLSAQSFYQVNRRAAERLYRAALEYASPRPDDVLLDLYCGAGAIGLSMAYAVKEVVGVEIVPQAIENAKQNAEQNGIENARFFCADASKTADILRHENIRPDIIVLDPPRKGVDEDALKLAAELSPRKIVYISCNSATLARDVKLLFGMGYKAVRARAADLFPRTCHVEAVVLMSRVMI